MPREEDYAQESAMDLVKHMGWKDFLADVKRAMDGQRHTLLYPNTADDSIKIAAASNAARGSIVGTKNIIIGVYQRAGVTMPPDVRAMFE